MVFLNTLLLAELLLGTLFCFLRTADVNLLRVFARIHQHRGFKAIIEGEMDDYPEAAFFNVGTMDEVVERAKEMGAKQGD